MFQASYCSLHDRKRRYEVMSLRNYCGMLRIVQCLGCEVLIYCLVHDEGFLLKIPLHISKGSVIQQLTVAILEYQLST